LNIIFANTSVFWVAIPYRDMGNYRRFRGTYRLHLQGHTKQKETYTFVHFKLEGVRQKQYE
jgi:hypothetical protein